MVPQLAQGFLQPRSRGRTGKPQRLQVGASGGRRGSGAAGDQVESSLSLPPTREVGCPPPPPPPKEKKCPPPPPPPPPAPLTQPIRYAPVRNGLVSRSTPIVVSSPCPLCTTVESAKERNSL